MDRNICVYAYPSGSLVPKLLFAEWTGKMRSGNETICQLNCLGVIIGDTDTAFFPPQSIGKLTLESSPGSLFVCNQYAISWPTGRTLISP